MIAHLNVQMDNDFYFVCFPMNEEEYKENKGNREELEFASWNDFLGWLDSKREELYEQDIYDYYVRCNIQVGG